MAICPNCRATLALTAESCSSCSATFGSVGWKPLPDHADVRASKGNKDAFEHYIRLTSEDLLRLLQTDVLSEEHRQLISEELHRRGDTKKNILESDARGPIAIEFLAVWIAFVIGIAALGRGAILTTVLTYLIFYMFCFAIAVVVARVVPKYRKYSYANLVRRTTRTVAVVAVVVFLSQWYVGR